MAQKSADIIELPAANPDGDLACDFTLAKDAATIREQLTLGLISPVVRRDDSIEASFRPDAWEAVRSYIEMESKCCSFLDLFAERGAEVITMRVSGRPEAREFIWSIFEAPR